jgi:hypothetical protein
MNEWWLYFGNIAPSKIVEFIVEEAIPYRPVPVVPSRRKKPSPGLRR